MDLGRVAVRVDKTRGLFNSWDFIFFGLSQICYRPEDVDVVTEG